MSYLIAIRNPGHTLVLPWLRVALTAAIGVAFLAMALFDERPLVMLIGLAPLALLATETMWHALAGLVPEGRPRPYRFRSC